MANRDHTPEHGSAKNKICKERRIKVNQLFYDYQPKREPKPYTSRAVPWIQMKGKWLEQAGFSIDMPVKIQVREGRLVLTAVQRDE